MQDILIIIVFVILLALIISMILNFKAMIDIKWNIDYMVAKDAVCKDYRWTKFELEAMRYNLSTFLYSGDTFARLVQEYTYTYSLITTIATILMVSCIAIKIYQFFYDKLLIISMPLLLMIIGVYIIHMVFTSKYLQTLTTIQKQSSSDADINILNKYYSCYKILNAAVVLSNIKDTKMDLSHQALAALDLTFDQLLERNIASYENTNNTSKVKAIKLEAYGKLDVLKYFVFDKLSPYFVKYFENPFIQNMYLDDLYAKYIKIKNEDGLYIAFATIKDKDMFKDLGIPDIVTLKALPSVEQYELYLKMQAAFDSTTTETDKQLITVNLKRIQNALTYVEINSKLKALISKSGTKLNIEDDDYIKYLLENKDVLFDDTKIDSFKNAFDQSANVIYAYAIYFAVFFIMLSHILYMTLEGSTYIYTLLSVIAFYFFFVWIYTQVSFMSVI